MKNNQKFTPAARTVGEDFIQANQRVFESNYSHESLIELSGKSQALLDVCLLHVCALSDLIGEIASLDCKHETVASCALALKELAVLAHVGSESKLLVEHIKRCKNDEPVVG